MKNQLKKYTLFLGLMVIFCLLTACKSDEEKVMEEKRDIIEMPYIDRQLLGLKESIYDKRFQEAAKNNNEKYVRWSGKLKSINDLFNKLIIKEVGLTKINIDFEYDVSVQLKELDIKEGDIVTFSGKLDYFNPTGSYWHLENGRIEKTSKAERDQVLSFRKVYKQKETEMAKSEAEKQAKEVAALKKAEEPENNDKVEYEIVSTTDAALNSIVYLIKTNAKTKEEFVKIIKELNSQTEKKNKDAAMIDFYDYNNTKLDIENRIAVGGIAYSNIGQAQTLLKESNMYYLEIGNNLEEQQNNHFEGSF
jgi:molecular chaperone DnaK (HSP70)